MWYRRYVYDRLSHDRDDFVVGFRLLRSHGYDSLSTSWVHHVLICRITICDIVIPHVPCTFTLWESILTCSRWNVIETFDFAVNSVNQSNRGVKVKLALFFITQKRKHFITFYYTEMETLMTKFLSHRDFEQQWRHTRYEIKKRKAGFLNGLNATFLVATRLNSEHTIHFVIEYRAFPRRARREVIKVSSRSSTDRSIYSRANSRGASNRGIGPSPPLGIRCQKYAGPRLKIHSRAKVYTQGERKGGPHTHIE